MDTPPGGQRVGVQPDLMTECKKMEKENVTWEQILFSLVGIGEGLLLLFWRKQGRDKNNSNVRKGWRQGSLLSHCLLILGCEQERVTEKGSMRKRHKQDCPHGEHWSQKRGTAAWAPGVAMKHKVS